MMNAFLAINNSILYLLSVHLELNFRELLTILCCVTSVSNFYTIYKLIVTTKQDIQQYFINDQEDNQLYIPESNSNLLFNYNEE